MGNSPQLRRSDELSEGAVLREKYRIEQKIGAGGMGTVYRARHLAFDELKAVKLVHAALLEDPFFLARFKAEAVITRKLQHPNAIRVKDIDTTEDGRPFIVMEYIEGMSLRQLMQKQGRFPVDLAVSLASQICKALQAAHLIGIIHRDIKPENVLVSTNGIVKVVDFGIAKAREPSGDTPMSLATRTGLLVGTPQYMSPEQALGKRSTEIDGRSDIYSAGLLLYEMLVGASPFHADTPLGFVNEQIRTLPVPLERERQGIPTEVSAAVMRALEKEPSLRFQTASEMLEALNGGESLAATVVAVTLPATQKPSTAITRVPSFQLPTERSNRAIIGFTVLLCIALATMGLIYWSGQSGTPTHDQTTATSPNQEVQLAKSTTMPSSTRPAAVDRRKTQPVGGSTNEQTPSIAIANPNVPVPTADPQNTSSNTTNWQEFTETVVDETISVPAGQVTARYFSVPPAAAQPTLEGTFSSTGGVGGNIQIQIVGERGTLYSTSRVTHGRISLALPSSGNYTVVVDNRGSMMFKRDVTLRLDLQYSKLQ
jgi:serine/threonine protein kinase